MRLILLVIVAVQVACAGINADRTPANEPAPRPTAPASAPAEAPPASQQTANAAGTATNAFLQRVKEYVAWRNKVEGTVQQLTETSDPNKIAERERAFGEALIKARGTAQQGEYLIKEFVPVLEQTIKADFAKRTSAERKALIVELPKGMKFGINQIYPSTIPLATFPGNLLKALPDLPPELEYRIIYRHLILRDVEGNYVVDMVPNIFPIPK
jgi:hypothetical protein